MQFFIFVLFVCLFVFLFCVYLLARDDFVMLRKDVTMERLFNIIFLGSLSCLFGARLFYGLIHLKSILFNPFVFLLFPYFPGLSLTGGVVGGGAAVFFLALNKKNNLPIGRLSDFFSIAFLITMPIGILGYFMLSEGEIVLIKAISLIVIYIGLFMFFIKFLLPMLLNDKLKEGTITLLFLICFSAISLISNIEGTFKEIGRFVNLENIVLIIMLIGSIVFLAKQEKLLAKLKAIKKK